MKINLKAENPISPSRTLGEKVNGECTSWFMTPEELTAYNEKNGYPIMKLSDRRGHHYMEAKKGVKKDAKKQVRGKKDAS
ncbi:hypothetical protein AMQ84_27160 [Paenibacillus riograndensis]|uniref:Uncharacterized protein n=1 Tax=Paenibacillus riograndensis TaxID=483937 RepID=A0A132TJZ1_9BACL|nr:hypothetical protein [Paenibacillus riograndensis]KWX71604.1 hypothetical protein AMQ84_27160 [Paenibacillus riograndensis]